MSSDLPIVIIHYHMQPGGVTQVIINQVKALQKMGRPYLLLTGTQYDGDEGVCQTVIPELNYKVTADSPKAEAEALFVRCIEAVTMRFSSSNVIWHFHNPTLGKNILFPALIELLTETKDRLLLQCHDFAEDGRPGNYRLNKPFPHLYPLAPNVHYALVNNRDLSALKEAGIPEDRLHLLHNTTSGSTYRHKPNPTDNNLVLYPVRGIRRKNLGELLLWSALAPEGTTFALTSAPKNTEWLPLYRVWEQLAKDLELPVIMDCVGNTLAPGKTGSTFSDWIQSATHCITTSIAEGFGLTFLEPLSQDIPLIGRDLPEVTGDLGLANMDGVSLYTKILVSIDHLDKDALFKEFRNLCYLYNSAYDNILTPTEVEKAQSAFTASGKVDFGNLPEQLQVFLLIKAKIDGFNAFTVQLENGSELHAQDWISQALAPRYGSTNSSDFISHFQPARYLQNYQHILHTLATTSQSPPSWLSTKNILDQYLRPERFNFLMS